MTDKIIPIIKSLVDEQMISVEVVYEPYKADAHGHWMRPETIEAACHNFNDNLAKGNIKPNLYHCKDDSGKIVPTEAFEVQKTWINQVECQIGDQVVPEGTWIAKLQWKDPDKWDQRKKGILKGVSLGGMGMVRTTEGTED